MSRRALEHAARLVALLAAAAARGADAPPVVLADDLNNPTSVAVREGPSGGVEVAVAESGAGRVVALTLLGDAVQSRATLVEGLAASPTAIEWTADGVLAVAGARLSLHEEGADGALARAADTAGDRVRKGLLTSPLLRRGSSASAPGHFSRRVVWRGG